MQYTYYTCVVMYQSCGTCSPPPIMLVTDKNPFFLGRLECHSLEGLKENEFWGNVYEHLV